MTVVRLSAGERRGVSRTMLMKARRRPHHRAAYAATLANLRRPRASERHQHIVQVVRNADLVVEEVFQPDKMILLGHRDQREQVAQPNADGRCGGRYVIAVAVFVGAGEQFQVRSHGLPPCSTSGRHPGIHRPATPAHWTMSIRTPPGRHGDSVNCSGREAYPDSRPHAPREELLTRSVRSTI